MRVDRKAGYAEIDPVCTHPDSQRGVGSPVHHRRVLTPLASSKRLAFIGSAPVPYCSNHLHDSLRPIERYEEFARGRTISREHS